MMDGQFRHSLRIAHVQPMTLDLFGHEDAQWGREVRYFMTNIAQAQARAGDRPTVHLLTSGVPHRMAVGGVEVVFHRCVQPPRSWPVTRRFGRQVSWSMLTALRRGEVDLVHFHGVMGLQLMHGAVGLRARQVGLPMVGSEHGVRRGWAVETTMHRLGLRCTDAVFAANAMTRDALRSAGVAPSALHVMPNGTDPAVFSPGPRRVRAEGEPFRILVVARLWEDKDPLTMAAAVAELAKRGHPVELTVIGQGVMRQQVEQALSAAAVAVTFIEHLPQTDLPDRYRAADAFLLTSLREGWNQATMEAMACGLPVVATDIPGIRDGVGEAGLLCPVRSPGLIADALEAIATDPDLARCLRENGLRRAQDFTWDAVVRRMREAYLASLSRSRPAPGAADGVPAGGG